MRHKTLHRRLISAAAAVAIPIVGVATAVTPAHAQDEPLPQPSEAAATWLADQADGPSWLDSIIGLMSAGVGGDQVQETLGWLNDTDILNAYVYPAEGDDAAIDAGRAGKTMYAVAASGGNPADFGGIDLPAEVAGSQLDGGHYSPGTVTGTAWAVLGLSRTDEVPNELAATALATAQCDDGGYSWESADGGGCVSEPDTTGLVVAALRAFDTDEATAAFDVAVQWLLDNQGEDGSFDNGFGANANSTAMAAQALLAAEEAEAAESALSFLLTLQIECGDDAAGAIRATDPEDPEFGEASRAFATAQALIPISGQDYFSLDASSLAADLPGVDCETATGGETSEDAAAGDAAADDDSEGTDWGPWIIVAAVVLLIAIGAYILVKVRGGKSRE